MKAPRLTLLTFLLVLAACGPAAPIKTTLAALSEAQRDFNGRRVEVSGVLRTFANPRHYWIENESLDRVALEGDHDFSSRVGQEVEVSGVFVFDRDRGRRIRVEDLEAAL